MFLQYYQIKTINTDLRGKVEGLIPEYISAVIYCLYN